MAHFPCRVRSARTRQWTILLSLLGAAAFAEEPVSAPAKKQLRAIRVDRAPQIDGKLDDEAWGQAVFVADFLQREPDEGAPPPELTRIGLVYDQETLYIGARMYSDDPAAIRALITRRDQETNSEQLVISLDTFANGLTAHSFGVTAAGVRLDYYHPTDDIDPDEWDYSFDPVWQAEVGIDAEGWTAEMAIPFSQLRFNEQEVQTWGVNMRRLVPAQNREDFWVLVPRSEAGWASWFGDLEGLAGIHPALGLELFPYMSGSAILTSADESDDPFAQERDLDNALGLDAELRLGPNLSLDATFNPDFGQVEADPAEVNLSQFETFFVERRPFFTEGIQFLNPGSRLFYSRRVGGPPRGRAAGDYVEQPDNTTIVGATKMTGRLASGLSIGALAAVTDSEYARTYAAETATFGREKVEPLTLYTVLRAQREFGPDASTAGLMLTTTHRDMTADRPLAQRLNRRAYTGRADFNLRFLGGRYALDGHFGFSHLRGQSQAIARLQRTSAHYFQRPDATHVTFDSTRTSMSGYIGLLELEKRSGQHWLWSVAGRLESPAFDLNDAGLTFTSDDIDTWFELTYRQTTPGTLVRAYNIDLRLFRNWNFGGAQGDTYARLRLDHTWRNFMGTALWIEARPRSLDDRGTRGGPLMGSPAAVEVEFGLESNPAQRSTWSVDIFYDKQEMGSWSWWTGAGLGWRPSARWEFSVDPSFSRSVDTRQYIATGANGRQETFAKRYIFAAVERRQIATQFRLNYALNPDLTLQSYMEPFAASGRFFDFGELPRPRSRGLRLYGTDQTSLAPRPAGGLLVSDGADQFALPNRDFNIRSLRSTFVLRWEWRRGSTLFAIWQQDRSAARDHGRPVGPAELWDAWTAQGATFFALKLRYWLPID